MTRASKQKIKITEKFGWSPKNDVSELSSKISRPRIIARPGSPTGSQRQINGTFGSLSWIKSISVGVMNRAAASHTTGPKPMKALAIKT